MENKKWSLV